MKNLKKVLALALAIALSLTMFAGAAFTDQEEINKTEAVDTLVALGVINGMPDGSFNPDGNVTRAEMAKMIYAVRMRGNTDAGNFAGLSTSFTDLYDTWYRGYVKWAQAAGIIDGKSATTFDPNGSVTGTEAAKMLLVLAGYTSDRAGLTGVNWETNTIRYASQAGLLDNMDNVDLSQALPREYAAQLIYNALFIPMVRWSNDSQSFEEITNKVQSGSADNDNSVTTIGLQYMDLRYYTGTFWGNYRTGDTSNGYVEIGNDDRIQNADNKAVKWDLDMDWIGEEVEVLYQDNNLRGQTADLDNEDTIYDIKKTNATPDPITIEKADLQNATDGKIKFNGVTYTAEDTTIPVYVNYKAATNRNVNEFDKVDGNNGNYYETSADTIKFVFNRDGEIRAAYIIEKTVSEIVSLPTDKVNIRGEGVLDLDDEDLTVSLYDDAAEGDYIYYANLYENDSELVVEQAETISAGKVTAIQDDKITIDDVTYDHSAVADNTSLSIKTGAGFDAGDEYDVVLYGDQWVAAEKANETAEDYALVTGADYNNVDGLTVNLLLSDNSTLKASVNEDYTAGITSNNYGRVTGRLVGYTLQDEDTVKLYATTLVETEENKSISFAKAGKTLTYTEVGETTATIKTVAAGGVAYLKNADGKWVAYATDTLANQTDTNANGKNFWTASNSDGELLAFVINTTATGVGEDLYAYVIDTAVDHDGDYKTLKLWSSEGEVTVRFGADVKIDDLNAKKGHFVKIEDFNANDEYNDVKILQELGDDTLTNLTSASVFTKIAVNEIASMNRIQVTDGVLDPDDGLVDANGNEVKPITVSMADDYKIIYVNTDDIEGAEGGNIQPYSTGYYTQEDVDEAPYNTAKAGDGKDYNNVLIVKNDNGAVIAIFVDVNNHIEDDGNYKA